MTIEAPIPNARPVQVPATHYGRKYLSLVRSMTHWYQADAVASWLPPDATVLVIGPGAGHTTWIMRNWGLQVTTLDFDPTLKPDIVGDVTALTCPDKSFGVVLAAEVLEHLPFSEFETALRELRRVAIKRVVLTLPAPVAGISLLLNLPLLKMFRLTLGIPLWIRHQFDGEHYWEMGKQGTPRATVQAAIRKAGFRVSKQFRPTPSLYCHFFIFDVN